MSEVGGVAQWAEPTISPIFAYDLYDPAELDGVQAEIFDSLPKAESKAQKRGTRKSFSLSQRMILFGWFYSHMGNPYPSALEKRVLASKTGLSTSQINVWFVNTRMRHLKGSLP